jgi:hypothetical protein
MAPAGARHPPTVAVAEPLAPEVMRAIQGRLRQLGFYPGQIDGLWSPAMQSSIERFRQGVVCKPTITRAMTGKRGDSMAVSPRLTRL